MMDEKKCPVEEFFARYRTMVLRNAILFVKDYHTAEDICQETFIRLAKNLDRVPPENVKGWLICVSERLAIDYLRKGGQYTTVVGLDDGILTHTDSAFADPYEIIERKEKCEAQKRVLHRLKTERPMWYEVLMMSCLEGMDIRTIGEQVGIHPALVSKWKARARKWLYKRYEAEEKEKDR